MIPLESSVSAAVEGPTDEAIVQRILRECGLQLGAVYGREGKDRLLEKLAGYNEGARFAPWIVLVDLDDDGPCPGAVRQRWLPEPASWMCLRIAVRAAEAWLLADRESFSGYFRVRASRLPSDPDSEPDPKRVLLNAIERSTSPSIRNDMLPRAGSGRRVGPAYVGRLIEFVETVWQPKTAQASSSSLSRAIEHVNRLYRLMRS